MPRRELARRFEPRYGVSHAMLEVEATYLAREAEDSQVRSMEELETRCIERQANCRHSWEQLQLCLQSLPERDRKILQSLLFRDVYHILELYLTHVRQTHPEAVSAPVTTGEVREAVSEPFREWLFGGQ